MSRQLRARARVLGAAGHADDPGAGERRGRASAASRRAGRRRDDELRALDPAADEVRGGGRGRWSRLRAVRALTESKGGHLRRPSTCSTRPASRQPMSRAEHLALVTGSPRRRCGSAPGPPRTWRRRPVTANTRPPLTRSTPCGVARGAGMEGEDTRREALRKVDRLPLARLVGISLGRRAPS